MRLLLRAAFCVPATIGLTGCWYGNYEYPPAQYVHRTDTITMSAGNAQEINEATQVIDPWKRGTADPRIPGHGERMGNAAERYRAKASASGNPPGQPANPSGSGPAATPTGPSSSGPAGAATP
jgi:hypothetical protein